MTSRPAAVRYHLPDGRTVSIAYDVCRAASYLSYALADGRIVLAVIAAGQ